MNITLAQKTDMICRGINLRVRGTVEHALEPANGNHRFVTRFNNGLTFTQEVSDFDVREVSEDRLIQALTNQMCVMLIKSMFKEEFERDDHIIY